MTTLIFGQGRVLRGYTPENDLSFTLVETPLVIAPTDTAGTSGDQDTRVITGEIAANNFRLGIQTTLGYTVDNLTPGVISLDANFNAALITPGEALVRITDSLGQQRLIRRQMTGTGLGNNVGTYHTGFRAGSLGRHITDAIQAMVSGKTPGAATMDNCSANNYNAAAPAVTRNAGLFCAGLDLSAISVIAAGGFSFPGALISSRHVLGAWHAPQPSPLVWKRQDGTYATANILSRARIDNTDLSVAYLDAAITGITSLKLLPADWKSYLFTAGTPYMKLPVLSKTTHAQNGASADQWNINNLIAIKSTHDVYGECRHSPCWCPYAPVLVTDAWYSPIIGGDSGGPVLVPVNGDPVLLGGYYTTGSLPMASNYLTEIGAAMNALAVAQGDNTPYAVQTVSLAGFNTY
jgi:hypothetical protein